MDLFSDSGLPIESRSVSIVFLGFDIVKFLKTLHNGLIGGRQIFQENINLCLIIIDIFDFSDIIDNWNTLQLIILLLIIYAGLHRTGFHETYEWYIKMIRNGHAIFAKWHLIMIEKHWYTENF